MEYGFYHPLRGYWQSNDRPDAETLASYPEGTVEVPLKPGADYEWDGEAWVHVSPDPAEALEAERAEMVCSSLQVRLAIGESEWKEVEDFLLDSSTPWAMRQAIQSAAEFQRRSQMTDELAWLMGYNETQVDDLFRLAMRMRV